LNCLDFHANYGWYKKCNAVLFFRDK
jgi:hypothetical protein